MGEWERINIRVWWGDEHEKRWEREAKQSNEKIKVRKILPKNKEHAKIKNWCSILTKYLGKSRSLGNLQTFITLS